MSRLADEYKTNVVPKLVERFGYGNSMATPRLTKIIVSMRIRSAEEKKEAMDEASRILSMITGQKAMMTKARQSVSGFKIREGDIVGCKVTLRGERMYEFLERLLDASLPRIRDFRGLNPDSFDGGGNYSLGIEECLIFPEVGPDDVKGARGMNITIVTSARTNDEGRELLRMLGMRFRDAQGGS